MPSTVEVMNNHVSPFATRRSIAATVWSGVAGLFTAGLITAGLVAVGLVSVGLVSVGLALAAPQPALAGGTVTEAATGRELIMVEQAGCEWCKRWNDEIGPIYPKTREGAFAPLRRVNLRAIPDDLKVTRRVTFTPTFLIVNDGHEMARLEGYPGEDFFWPLIAQLMSRHLGLPAEGADLPES